MKKSINSHKFITKYVNWCLNEPIANLSQTIIYHAEWHEGIYKYGKRQISQYPLDVSMNKFRSSIIKKYKKPTGEYSNIPTNNAIKYLQDLFDEQFQIINWFNLAGEEELFSAWNKLCKKISNYFKIKKINLIIEVSTERKSLLGRFTKYPLNISKNFSKLSSHELDRKNNKKVSLKLNPQVAHISINRKFFWFSKCIVSSNLLLLEDKRITIDN